MQIAHPTSSSRTLFIGIPVVEAECPKFFAWSKNLVHETELAGLQVRWSKPENYHITISFLGDSADHPIDQITNELQKLKLSPFWVQIQQLGFFLNGKHSNIMWAGVESKDIESFYQTVQKTITPLGYPKSLKPFRPHITLGRLKKFDHELKEGTIATTLDQFKVNRFCLFESIFTSSSVEYKILETFYCK